MQKNSRTAVPYLMQYQGSKRRLAALILPWLPHCRRLIEPFAGSAAITLAAAAAGKAELFWLNDLNAPLMALWQQALTAPDLLYQNYAALWQEQFAPGTDHLQHYAAVRARFNAAAQGAPTADAELPAMFLYLMLRCVKGAVRYNASGEFNQAPDKRRHGTAPERLKLRLYQVCALLSGRTELSALDFMQVLLKAEPADVVYLDPPYQGVSREAHARSSAMPPASAARRWKRPRLCC